MKKLIKNYKQGMKIKYPCIIRNMPNNVYHNIEGLSTSGLKMLLDCPARYYHKYLSDEYTPKEKPHFKIGKACHTIILEGEEAFYSQYWHNPFKNLKKDELVQLLCDKYGYDISIKKFLVTDLMEMLLSGENIEKKEIELDSNELNQIVNIAKSINKDKYARNAFKQHGESELSLFWIDKETGLKMKCRPDFLPYDCQKVPDYKTCQSVNPNTFWNDFIKYGYHLQAAQYRTGIKECTGTDVDCFFFIAQEKEEPYISQVFLPDMTIIDYGEKAVKKAIKIYQECKADEIWRGYSDFIIQMSISPKPEELISNFDEENGIAYAPAYIDKILASY